MRGIGDKAALSTHGLGNTVQETIDRHNKRAHLDGEMIFFHGVQRLLSALVNFPRKRGNGPEHFSDQISNDHKQDGHQNQERDQGAQSTVSGYFIANACFLRHRDPLSVGRGLDQHAKWLTIKVERVQSISERGREWQRHISPSAADCLPAIGKMLDDDAGFLVLVFGLFMPFIQGQGQSLSIKECSHLPQRVVLQLMRFIERGKEGKNACHSSHKQDDQRQRDRQLELNGRVQASFETIHPTPLTFLMTSPPNFRRNAWIKNSTALLSTSSPHP